METLNWKNLVKPRTVCGVQLHVNEDGKGIAYTITLEQKGQLIKVLSQENIPDAKLVTKKIPVVLSLSGKGVLLKEINYSETEDQGVFFKTLLPGTPTDEIVYSLYALPNGKALCAFARKTLVTEWLTRLENDGLTILGLHVGPLAMLPVLDALYPHEVKQLAVPGFEINWHGHGMAAEIIRMSISAERLEQKHAIGGEQIVGDKLLAFGGAFAFLAGLPAPQGNGEPLLSRKEDFLYKTIFNKAAVTFCAFFFVMLLANFMVNQNLLNKNVALRYSASANKSTIQLLDSLRNKYDHNSAFLKKEGWLSSPLTAYYADEIATMVTDEMSLTALTLYPEIPNKRRKLDERVLFDSQFIVMEGEISNSMILNQWINQLKQRDWVGRCEIASYTQSQKMLPGKFVLHINIKPKT